LNYSIFSYGGPDSYQVTKRFAVDWSAYLTVNKSIIYAAIDGRGSGLKGNNMLFAVYKHLGGPEVDDQVNVTRLRVINTIKKILKMSDE
jgi:dipeptidyl-peptidase-4